MNTIKTLQLGIIILLTFSCSTVELSKKNTTDSFDREYQIGAYLWFQTSGEYQALCHQAYNLGRMKLDRDLENKHNRKRAVVLDIDETVLDNSFGGADEIKT
ncbi:MAG: 5'-nucleotidase, lipoprotein e(P4) family, partial [Alphaproteobacteria bacterium]